MFPFPSGQSEASASKVVALYKARPVHGIPVIGQARVGAIFRIAQRLVADVADQANPIGRDVAGNEVVVRRHWSIWVRTGDIHNVVDDIETGDLALLRIDVE